MSQIRTTWAEDLIFNLPLYLIWAVTMVGWVWPTVYRWYLNKIVAKWPPSKIAGYVLGKCVDEMPVDTAYGKFNVVEMEDIEILKRGTGKDKA